MKHKKSVREGVVYQDKTHYMAIGRARREAYSPFEAHRIIRYCFQNLYGV